MTGLGNDIIRHPDAWFEVYSIYFTKDRLTKEYLTKLSKIRTFVNILQKILNFPFTEILQNLVAYGRNSTDIGFFDI